jgi:hypothetical protein
MATRGEQWNPCGSVWTATFVDGPMEDSAARAFLAATVYDDLWYFPWPGHPGEWAYLGPTPPDPHWDGQVHYRRKDQTVNENHEPIVRYEMVEDECRARRDRAGHAASEETGSGAHRGAVPASEPLGHAGFSWGETHSRASQTGAPRAGLSSRLLANRRKGARGASPPYVTGARPRFAGRSVHARSRSAIWACGRRCASSRAAAREHHLLGRASRHAKITAASADG